MGCKASKKKEAAAAAAAAEAKAEKEQREASSSSASASSSSASASNEKVNTENNIIKPSPSKLSLRQDSVAYNKTAIQKRKDAKKSPGYVREGTSTADLLNSINSTKSLHCKYKYSLCVFYIFFTSRIKNCNAIILCIYISYNLYHPFMAF